MDHPLPLLSTADRQAARTLIERCGLRFETDFDDLLGLFADGQLAGCGARRGRVLKMLVVAPEQRGSGLIGIIVSELMRRGREAGCQGFFIFTQRCTAASFASLGFETLVGHEQAVLLEHGQGLRDYLRRQVRLTRSGHNGAVVISADPVTLGHQFLIEQAASQVDHLYVMVPSEGRFALPLTDRLTLTRQATAHLDNTLVLETGPYLLGTAAFPAYFLKPDATPERIRLEIDADLFGQHLAPFFDIRYRLVGSEPVDPLARFYNRILRQRLARWDIRLIEFERRQQDRRWITTAQARAALARQDWTQLTDYLPPVTVATLRDLPIGTVDWTLTDSTTSGSELL